MILLDIMNKPDEQKRGINIHPYPKRTLLNQSQKSCADLLLRQYHLAYVLYASIYFLVK